MTRELKFYEAIREATQLCMEADPSVYVMGLGVPDPKGIFGTTLGLQEKFGVSRVLDMPTSENAMTGVALGSALVGLRPILTHQRVDFALLSMEQIINQAAKWHYMFGGKMSVPLVIRLMIGRGWGQGPQHSQSLHSLFGHIPGLKVVMPFTPYDAKGLLIQSIEDNNPVIFYEHRWLHNLKGPVPEGMYRVPIGKARVVRKGEDVTIVSVSHMTLEAIRAHDRLKTEGVSAEVIDLRSIRPLDTETILTSVSRTGRLLVADLGWREFGMAAEVIACVAENAHNGLKAPPRRICLPNAPTPTSPALANSYYPLSKHIVQGVCALMDDQKLADVIFENESIPLDVPDMSFMGPF